MLASGWTRITRLPKTAITNRSWPPFVAVTGAAPQRRNCFPPRARPCHPTLDGQPLVSESSWNAENKSARLTIQTLRFSCGFSLFVSCFFCLREGMTLSSRIDPALSRAELKQLQPLGHHLSCWAEAAQRLLDRLAADRLPEALSSWLQA